MKVICTKEEKEAMIDLIVTSQNCFYTWKCCGNCKECIEQHIEFDTGDNE